MRLNRTARCIFKLKNVLNVFKSDAEQTEKILKPIKWEFRIKFKERKGRRKINRRKKKPISFLFEANKKNDDFLCFSS